MIVPKYQSYGSYGTLGCTEWDILMDRLKLLLAQAESSGASSSNAYIAAKSYFDNNTGFWGTYPVLFGSACAAQIIEVNAHLSKLASAISSAGSTPVIEGPEQRPDESVWNSLSGTVKWVVGGAVAVSAAVLAVKVLPFFEFMKPKRRRYSAWDPEQRDLEGYSKKRKRAKRRKS